ncbi:MAG: F0F1 ATP synthase subunit B [Verrucomicrobiota bacterium]|nr:F0F1 ATP synthase subunit B [Verrucomicrobiota bacterium]
MSEDGHSTVVEVPPKPGPARGGEPPLMDVSGSLMLWTWVSFAVVAIILYKTAWKPIMRALDDREKAIRKALEDAEKARAEMAEATARRRRILADSDAEARRIVAEAKAGALDAAEKIEKQTRDNLRRLKDDAERQIEASAGRARAALRAESAELAVLMAERALQETMDPARQKELVDRLVKEI